MKEETGRGFKHCEGKFDFRKLLPFLDDLHRIRFSKTWESGGCDPWDWDLEDQNLTVRRR